MIPLRVTVLLDGPVTLYSPIALDGLLASMVVLRDGIPPAATEEEMVPIEIPVAREPGGRFHLASLGEYQVERSELRYCNRRFPIEEAQMLGASIKRVQINAGPSKAYRIPHECVYLVDDAMRWYCVGEPTEIRSLLTMCFALGKKRSVGRGEVREWLVEEVPADEMWEGFPVSRDGRPLRPLPRDWAGVGGDDCLIDYRRLTYPYWIAGGKELCVSPPTA